MSRKWILFIAALALIGVSAGVLQYFKTHHKLGLPGVKTSPLAASKNLRIELPERVLDYDSEWVEVDNMVRTSLPADTSYGQRRYFHSTNEFPTLMNVVLMGSDRTSIHKPEFCLIGAGWSIDSKETTSVRIERPHVYDLPVRKFMTTRDFVHDGQVFKLRGIYVFWFVADHKLAANHGERMWSMAKHLLTTGELQRWAYVTCFSVCAPGQEDATFQRMKQFIAASVPEFQLAVKPPVQAEREPLNTAGK